MRKYLTILLLLNQLLVCCAWAAQHTTEHIHDEHQVEHLHLENGEVVDAESGEPIQHQTDSHIHCVLFSISQAETLFSFMPMSKPLEFESYFSSQIISPPVPPPTS